MIFRVNINKWLRGTGCGTLLERGKMCCLGFAEIQCGAEPKDIQPHYEPSDLGSQNPTKAVGVLVNRHYRNTRFSNSAITINDRPSITDTERMKQLRALAKKHGHRFVFVKE